LSAPVIRQPPQPNTVVPTAPMNSYGGRTANPYSIPTAPANPYQVPAGSQSPPAQATAPMIPYQTAIPAASSPYASGYIFRCLVNTVGDFCTGTAATPVGTGNPCICGQYNGYTQ